ncbi:MAG: hypothetical protein ACKVZJ_03675 [Phycisphaerales bacterium]
MIEINEELARKVLQTVDAGLVRGLGEQVPGRMCVEAAVNYAMGADHSDRPSCVGAAVRAFKIRLNDAAWPTDKDRTDGMRRLAIAQLGSDQIDQTAFREYVVVETIKRILPIALRAAGSMIPAHKDALEAAATACEGVVDLSSARAAARVANEKALAARVAAYADAYAADAYAAAAAAYAAAAAADDDDDATDAMIRALWHDYDLLFAIAKAEGWTDDSPADPDLCGPLWPFGKPEGWPEDAPDSEERKSAIGGIEVTIEIPDGMSDDDTEAYVDRLVDGLDDYHRALGGHGLFVLPPVDVRKRAGVTQGAGS